MRPAGRHENSLVIRPENVSTTRLTCRSSRPWLIERSATFRNIVLVGYPDFRGKQQNCTSTTNLPDEVTNYNNKEPVSSFGNSFQQLNKINRISLIPNDSHLLYSVSCLLIFSENNSRSSGTAQMSRVSSSSLDKFSLFRIYVLLPPLHSIQYSSSSTTLPSQSN